MPSVSQTEGLALDPGTILPFAFGAVFDGEVTFNNSTTVTMTSGVSTVTVSGINLLVGDVGGVDRLIGGTLNSITVNVANVPGYLVQVFGLTQDIGGFRQAWADDMAGTDPTAFERLVLPLDWTYIGNTTADEHDQNVVDGNGVVQNFEGNDFFDTGFNQDKIWSGRGNDTVRAGQSDDTLMGGAGRDRLFGEAGDDLIRGGKGNDYAAGGAGDDRIFGAAGDDTLLGGFNQDLLIGGQGNDLLDGGLGNDTLRGSDGADTFRFRVQEGDDLLQKFEVGVDVIALEDFSTFNVSHGSNFTLLTWDGGSVRLQGIDSTEFDINDILLV